MKKIILLGITLFSFMSLKAQTSKGSWMLSGKTSLGFNSVSTKYSAMGFSESGPKVSTFSLTPSVGYFVMDNVAIGVDLSISSTKTSESGISMTASTVSFLPNAMYYFPSGSNIRPFLGAGVGYGSNKMSEGSTSLTSSGLVWGGKGGVIFLLNDNIGFDFGLSYNNLSSSMTEQGFSVKTNTGTFGVNAGISVFLGN